MTASAGLTVFGGGLFWYVVHTENVIGDYR
jgi:hypothetical protein